MTGQYTKRDHAIRLAISVFILLLIAVCVLGWRWTGSHQPPAQAAASHLVLAMAIVTGVAGLIALWRRQPGR